jgi:hypothetical protein
MSGQNGGRFSPLGGGIIGYPLDRLHKEIAYIAYHFHWSHDRLMQLDHFERLRWVNEIADINRKLTMDVQN